MNAPFLRPHGCPIGVDPVMWRKAIEARIETLQDVIATLIAALDLMDIDEDLEPSLAGVSGATDDCELTDEDGGDILDENHDGALDQFEGEDFEDGEYSLSWTIAQPDVSQEFGSLMAGYGYGDLEG